MTADERRVVKAVLLWQMIANEPLEDLTEDDVNMADADHSALLQRLLEGKAPLPQPPPKAFSYPWYDLIEKGEATCEAMVWQNGAGLVINQSLWHVIHSGDGEFLVEWPETGLLCRVWEDPALKQDGSKLFYWRIRVEPAQPKLEEV